jgi:hypothetical protein
MEKVHYRVYTSPIQAEDSYNSGANGGSHDVVILGAIGGKENSFKSIEDAHEAVEGAGLKGRFLVIPYFQIT